MEYLLDTNICIYIIKKKPMNVFDKFRGLSMGSIAISSITLAELQYGITKSSSPIKNQQALDTFLTPIEILDFGYDATVEYGIIRTELERKGTLIGSLDMLIAAHAKSFNLTLVTNNEKEFEHIIGLKIENWINK